MKAPIEVQFAQKLAANEPWVRDKAVKKLKKWFGAKTEAFDDVEMMKLWKGLYYCFWMSDKPLVQEELAENVSSFVTFFQSSESSLVFIRSFLKTFSREWFGIDRWRTDKFMMFTRRFLRHTFRFVAAKEWEKDLVEKLVEIFRREVVLCPVAHTSLGFQLHFTDVFLEEIAKVGGEKLDPVVLEMFLEPYVEVVSTGDDARFRDHVVERIFNHLMRQSDPGIHWQMEEDGETFEEMEEGESDEENGEANGEANGDGEESEGENGVTNGEGDSEEENGVTNGEGDSEAEHEDVNGEVEEAVVEDPRAGRVDAIIPQINVNYLKLSERLFELGSGDSIRKGNRDALYKVSKMFKDVANDLFPLGPNLDDLDIDIPKISVKKSAADLLKRNEEILKKNLEDKIKNKKLMSKLSKKAKIDTPVNGDDLEGSEESVEEEQEDDIEDESSSDEEMEEAIQKEKKISSKELRRKRKQEQRKRKREKAFTIEQEKLERLNQAQKMIEQDMDRKVASMEPVKMTNGVLEDKEDKIEDKVEKLKNLEKKKKKKEKILQNGAEVTNDSQAVKELIKLAEDLEENSEKSIKKKKKKKDRKQDPTEETICTEIDKTTASDKIEESNDIKVNLTESSELTSSFIKKKKKKEKKHTSTEEVMSTESIEIEATPNVSMEVSKETEASNEQSLSVSKKKKKKKDKNQAAADSSVCSPDSSQFFTPNTSIAVVGDTEALETKTPDLTESKKKKKLKRSATEAELGSEVVVEKVQNLAEIVEEPIIKPQESTPKSMKKMKKKKKEMHRIDSDIDFNAPSLSKINLMLGKSEETKAPVMLAAIPEVEKSEPPTPTENVTVSAKKKKKMKKYNAETSLLVSNDEPTATPITAPVFPTIEEEIKTPKSEKKKKKLKSNKLEFGSPGAKESGVSPKSTKVFEENNSWGDPLKHGETEIVLPNKKYKGSEKMKEPAESDLNGLVTPAKSYTSTFLKKALSKSVDSKKIKKDKKMKLLETDKCMSEPRKKKVNIMLTQNKSSDIPSHLRSVKNSPQTPHDPSKNPAKGVLKKRVSMESGNRLNPVQLNTQLNGRRTPSGSKALVGKKRKSALDFF